MFGSDLRSDLPGRTAFGDGTPDLPSYVRAQGQIRLSARRDGAVTRIVDLHEAGGFRCKFPRSSTHLDAVIVNAAGGLAGGDSLSIRVAAADSADVVVSMTAAEKVYGSLGAETRISVGIQLGAEARLAWLPQEMILYDQSRLRRTLEVDMDPTARLVFCEMTVLGRQASGEVYSAASFGDSWSLRRGGRLVFADRVRLQGDIATLLARSGTGHGASAFATCLIAEPDVAERLDAARAALHSVPTDHVEAAASAWDGLLVARFLASSGGALRRRVERFLRAFHQGSLPRVWLT